MVRIVGGIFLFTIFLFLVLDDVVGADVGA